MFLQKCSISVHCQYNPFYSRETEICRWYFDFSLIECRKMKQVFFCNEQNVFQLLNKFEGKVAKQIVLLLIVIAQLMFACEKYFSIDKTQRKILNKVKTSFYCFKQSPPE